MTSLNLVSDELVATIEQSASKLEQFVVNRNDKTLLQDCIDGVQQINGTLRLIQLHGAEYLTEAIQAIAEAIKSEDVEKQDEGLSLVTSAFFVLPRYLEYTQQARRGMPVLLIPHINELRAFLKTAPLPESHFFEVDLSASYPVRKGGSSFEITDLASLTRRLRHMFQIGLLSILQNKQQRSALGLMQRALERLEIITGSRTKAKLWGLGSAALEVLRTNNMELNLPRKLMLSKLDREIKNTHIKGLASFEEEPPEILQTQLIFLLALAHKPNTKAQEILSAYGCEPLGYSDKELRREREALKGPSVNTVASVAAVIIDEVQSIKDTLERAAEAGKVDDYNELIQSLVKIGDTLNVVGLVSAGQSLRAETNKLEGMQADEGSYSHAVLTGLADALLYVESTVDTIEHLNLSDEILNQTNSQDRDVIIANSQLARAEEIVIDESESGLALVKRALNSFAESNYDPAHIQNVSATLNSIRGGMQLLKLERAAGVVNSCAEFIDETLKYSSEPAALYQLLETFADAVIGLEYYLDALKTDKDADPQVLSIAEESLEALGHGVVAA